MKSSRDAVFADPLRSSGGLREASRLQRGIAEFLRLPLIMTAGFALAGMLVSVLDAASRTGPVRRVAEAIVPGSGATNLLSAVAPSLLTVTSITFSVLLVAVQQSASSLTTVVFDQFLRRRPNQLYFGFFVGLTAFTFLVLGLSRTKPAPVYGAVITLILTVGALVVLLLLIHSTIDQMRPQSVVRSIHELALRAREHELDFLGRTRPERRTSQDEPERRVRVGDSGYVVSIDVGRLARVAERTGHDGEIVVHGRLGEYVIFGDTVAVVVGADRDDDRFDEEVLEAFRLDDLRDVDGESGYAIDQLENIAWASGTSANQSPYVATTAIRALRDLAGRWLIAGERDRSHLTSRQEEAPVVYRDGAVERIAAALATLVIGTAESRQEQTCAELLHAFADLVPRLENDADRRAFGEALDSSLPAIIQHADHPRLREALAALVGELDREGYDTSRVREVQDLLTEARLRLLPKGSDEPEAAHPA